MTQPKFRFPVLTAFLLVILWLVLSFLPASADIAPPEHPPGSNLAPGEEGTQVQMLSETVLIEVQTAPWPGVPLSSVVRDWAKVTATFTMVNQGQVDESMQVRFPITHPMGWGDGRGEYPAIEDIRIWVDGVRAYHETIALPAPGGSVDPGVLWAGFDVTFPAGQAKEIEVRYSQRASGYHPQSIFTYIVETGAGWKDAIGSAELILRFPYPAGPENVLVDRSNAGIRFQGADARWSFEQLEPTWEDNLSVTFIEPGYWLAVLDAQKAVDLKPTDGEAWGALARALKLVTLEHKGWLREDEAGLDLYNASVEAYEQAIAFAPDTAKWHAGYAELLWRKIWIWPDYGAAEFPTILERLQQALELDPFNEQARGILDEMRYSAPLAVSVEGDQVDYLMLTATIEPSPTVTPAFTATPTATETPVWTPTPLLTATIGEEQAAVPSPVTEGSRAPFSCLGGTVILAIFPVVTIGIAGFARERHKTRR